MKTNESAHSRRKPLRGRASGRSYENTPKKIRAIKEKYKNGVPTGEVERWIYGNVFEVKNKNDYISVEV